MFRKKPKKHLKEVDEWPNTLDGYGLFVDQSDRVRLISEPEEKMIYKLTTSTEYNDRRLAAFRRGFLRWCWLMVVGVLSNMAIERLERLGMRGLLLPLGVREEEPHTVVLVSRDFETNMNKLAVLVDTLG
jgi:hypothetical protein